MKIFDRKTAFLCQDMFSPLWQEVKIFYGVVDFVVCNGYNMGRILLPLRTIENSFCKFSIVMNQGGVVMNIRPSAAIRQNYNEIADLCRKTAEPIQDDTVYVDYILDCRKDYSWLIR